MTIGKTIFISLFSFVLSAQVIAETLSYRFELTVPYEKKGFGSDPKDGEMERALELALEEVWNRHRGSVSENILRQYETPENKVKIASRLDEIVSFQGSPATRVDKKARVIKIGGRGLVNTTLINAMIGGGGSQDLANIPMGFLILPRLQKTVTTYDVEREQTEGASAKQMQEQAMRLELSGDASNVSGNAVVGEKRAAEITTRSGGSTTRTVRDADYIIGDVRQVTNGLDSFFTRSGFQASNYSDIAAYCGGPDADLVMSSIVERSSGDIPGDLRRDIFEAARDPKCLAAQFFIEGTIDVDSIRVNAQGNLQASAILNIKVTDLRAMLPKSFATIRSIEVNGSGPTEDVAIRDAIDNAALRSGEQILAAFQNNL
jgi:hypothetical protein